MQAQIDNAFAALNARLIAADQEFAKAARARAAAKVAEMAAAGQFRGITEAKIAAYGSKAIYNLLEGRSEADALAMMEKNSLALIAKRDAQIIAALTKAGVTELPEFQLVEMSDGLEGRFMIAGKTVSIRTILAGGYNIQRLHNRTLVKVF